MKKRVLSIALVLLLVVSILPVNASAAAEASDIRKQITSMYWTIKARSGMASLNGYCGLMTSWQLYLLGIDETLAPRDGRDQYDTYCNQTITNGGYLVRPYPAEKYTLEEALNAISNNGTRDVYNLLVGFQWTNTEAGSRCGHSLIIHGIIGGKVYFMEGFDMSIGGHYVTGGQAVECSISDFCSYYSGWCSYEGIIYFGLCSYASTCQSYSANLYVQAASSTVMTMDIPGQEEEYRNPEILRSIASGEWLHVTAVYETPDGSFYYQVSEDGESGFVPVGAAKLQSIAYDDITIEKVQAPGLLWRGQGFSLKGTITAEQNVIDTVLVEVYPEGEDLPVMALEAEVDAQSYSLSCKDVNQTILFWTLAEGTYEYKVSAVVANHYVKNGRLQTERCTIPLWDSQFQVGGDRSGRQSVVFDACGGTTTENQMIVLEGVSLPTAERPGYTFLGWYTEPKGGTYVTDETATGTVYAHWGPRTDGYTGWDLVDGAWRYYKDGILQTGWLTSGGINYFLKQDGSAAVDWTLLDEIASISAALILLESPVLQQQEYTPTILQ